MFIALHSVYLSLTLAVHQKVDIELNQGDEQSLVTGEMFNGQMIAYLHSITGYKNENVKLEI